MKIIFIEDKEKWNKFILENRGSFLQSWEWGQIQEDTGKKIWRMWFVDEKIDENQPIFCAQIIKHDLPFKKNYLYIPQGPIYRRGIIEKIEKTYQQEGKNPKEIYFNKKANYFEEFLGELKNICREEGSIFLKMEPVLKSDLHRNCLLDTELKLSDKEIQPSQTIILDLEKSEDELLAEMKSKTRYNIRLAQKHGVKIKEMESDDDFEKFWSLMSETAQRDEFSMHSKDYYRKIIETKSNDFKNILYLAEYKNNVLAVAIINFFNNKAIYLHGASSSSDRNVMAPYLLHFEIMKYAKNSNLKQYDLWGISEKWPGVTRFKQGFGGKEIKYLGAFDLVVDKKWYWIYSLVRRLR